MPQYQTSSRVQYKIVERGKIDTFNTQIYIKKALSM
jgi:hypothetical protein